MRAFLPALTHRNVWLYPALALVLAGLFAGLRLAFQNSDDAACVVINAGLVLLPWFVLAAITRRLALAAAIASAIAIFLWSLGELKFKYFGNRLALLDLPFFTEWANWAITWRYPLLWKSLLGFAALVAVLIAAALRVDRSLPRLQPGARVLMLAWVALWCAFTVSHRKAHLWEVFRDDADCGITHTCGVMARLVYSYSVLEFAEPLPSGDPALFESRRAELSALPPAAPDAPKPDVVVWLNESTFNPRYYKLPKARLPRLRLFETTEQTRAGGLLRVHTFGGKTWLSEFSLLTGLVPDDFGARRSLVFNAVAPQTRHNLPRLMKAAGYRTVVLMPTAKHFYGAGRSYEGLGFDEVLTLRDFPEYDHVKGDEWDIAESPRLGEAAANFIERHRAAHPTQPLFLYLLSVQEHAPYSKTTPVAFGLDKAGIKPSLAARLSDYFGRIIKLDTGLTRLEKTLNDSTHPALWLWFGDHQAYFEQDPPPFVFDQPEGKNITQFQVRSNFPTGLAEAATPFMDIAFLPGIVAELSGVALDDYFAALIAMRRLCHGRLDECDDHALVQSYKGLVYSEAMGMFAPQ